MSRLIKDLIEVSDHQSLDQLIAQLNAIRDQVPEGGTAEVRMRGDDRFGRHLCVITRRALSPAEAECEARYGGRPTRLRRAA